MKRWCAWCGADLPRELGAKRQFCCEECRAEFIADGGTIAEPRPKSQVAGQPPFWTSERDALLRDMRARRCSLKETARALGTTASACAGRLRRLGTPTLPKYAARSDGGRFAARVAAVPHLGPVA